MTSRGALLLVLAGMLGACTFGCSASPSEDDDSNLVASTDDPLNHSGPTYPAGTQLRTTANLNLRATASTNGKVLRVIPQGSLVTVRTASGGNAWVALRFNGYDGWAYTGYLVKASSGSIAGYSSSRANKLASKALREDGHAARGYCALEVSNSVVASGILPNGVTWYRNNAIDISEYMASHTSYDKTVGFSQINVTPTNIPKGSIIGWR
ncbi:MAG: SH3 domain-containing protein, partial [Polyangiaceae bacterium]